MSVSLTLIDTYRPCLTRSGAIYPDYWVSRDGTVLSTQWSTGIIRKTVNVQGYELINLCRARTDDTVGVHILVARSWIGMAPTPEHQINHKNGVKNDNHVDNLEWVTPKENVDHAMRNGLIGKRRAPKLTDDEVRELRALHRQKVSVKELARRFGRSLVTVSLIANRHSYKHVA